MSPRDHLVGLPAQAVAVDPTLAVHDMYDRVGGELYDLLVSSDLEAAVPARYAQSHGGPALDLACGSGRLTIPLAARGLDVLAVDLSSDMLERLGDRLTSQPDDVRDRVELLEADMTTLKHDDLFRLIVLGATSIVLVDPESRVDFFRNVRDLLAPDGVFLFDIHDLDRRSLRRKPHRLSVVPVAVSDTLVRYAITAQHFDLANRTEQVAMLVQTIEGTKDSPATRPMVITTQKRIVFEDEILTDLRAAGLELSDRVADPSGTFTWLIATRGGG